MEKNGRKLSPLRMLMVVGLNVFAILIVAAMAFLVAATMTDTYNPRWGFVFPFFLLFVSAMLSGFVIVILRFGRIAGAVTGFICGAFVSFTFTILIPQVTALPEGGIPLEPLAVIAVITILSTISGATITTGK